MPTVRCVRIGLYFSAIVLVGALTTLPVFSEDSGSSGVRDKQRLHPSEDAAGNAVKPDQSMPRDDKAATPEGQRLPDANVTTREWTPENIDTRNGVPPRRPNSKPNTIGDINARPESPAVKNLHRRTFPPQQTSHPVLRNSIGMPIPPREGGEQNDREHPDALTVPHSPVSGSPSITGNAAGRFPKAEGHLFDRPVPNTTPIVKPIAPNHAAINGTGVVRRGSGPPQIGGPTTATTGINGTTIRPPH
jgi:hypothetical protein